jgi:hypothetical protein
MGLAVTCRQYFLALPFAAGVLTWIRVRQGQGDGFEWLSKAGIALLLGISPVIAMGLVWKGLTSPKMAEGSSLKGLKVSLGLNFSRPLIVAFYILVYLLPFTFPAISSLKRSLRSCVLFIAILCGLTVNHFSELFLQPGPLNRIIQAGARIPHGSGVFLVLVTAAASYNGLAVLFSFWNRRQRLMSCMPVAFSLLVVAFFVLEQLGVGGNVPFFDRYNMQIAPFLGILAFAMFPELTRSRAVVISSLSLVSHFMLWRFTSAV